MKTVAIEPKYIGVIPAAGYASRLKNLTFSKEIYPLSTHDKNGFEATFPVCQSLISAYKRAGITNIFVILRRGKEDIREKLGSGEIFGVKLNYLYTDIPYGPAFTVDQAYSNYLDYYVALGFPDILFKPHKIYKSLIKKQQSSQSDVVLGLYIATNPKAMDMVRLDNTGHIKAIEIKPQKTELIWTWIAAAWSSKFSGFMHEHLKLNLNKYTSKENECHVGTVFNNALQLGMKFSYVTYKNSDFIDIGTPEGLHKVKIKLMSEDWSEVFI